MLDCDEQLEVENLFLECSQKNSYHFTPEWLYAYGGELLTARINESINKSILFIAWHLVGYQNSKARIIIVSMCDNHSVSGPVLVHTS